MKSPRSIRLIALVIGSLLATGQAVAQTYSSGVINAPITDLTTTQSSIHVTGGLASIARATVQVNIRHAWIADLDLVLVPPQGDAFIHLCSDVGGSGRDFQRTIFDSASTVRINAAGDGFLERYRPEGGELQWQSSLSIPPESLSGLQSLAGRSADGVWTLMIFDDAIGGEGELLDWSLSFAGPGSPSSPRVECLAESNSIGIGSSCVIRAIVTRGEFPASTGMHVSINAHALGGGTTVARDDGIEPDVQADDGTYAATLRAGSIAPGAYEVFALMEDAQGRTAMDSTTVRILPPPTPDDACVSPTHITWSDLPYVDPGDDVAGNAELNEHPLNCAAGGASNATRSRWFRFECANTGSYVITTDAPGTTASDTVLAVYEGESCGDLHAIACDDDGAGLRSYIRILLEQGSVYHIQAAPWSSVLAEAGSIALSLREDPEVGSCCLATGCEVLTRTECESQSGAYNGDGTSCNPGAGPRSVAISAMFDDISTEGVELALGDDGILPVMMPFSAPTVVGVLQAFSVSANGFVSVQNPGASFSNCALSLDASVTRLCPLWDDLDASFGSVRYLTRGTPGIDRRFIVQWTNVPQFATPQSSNTFQIVIYESGEIEFRYDNIDSFGEFDVTVGVRNVTGDIIVPISATNLADAAAWRIEEDEGQPLCAPCGWISNGCGADYTADGAVDGDDVIAFFVDWDNAVPCADVDGTQSVDGDDVIEFFTLWDAGGC